MVKYECVICSKIFNLKGNYTQHINRKYPCEPSSTKIEPIIIKPELNSTIVNEVFNDTQCCCCKKLFINKSSRIRHEKTSKCFYENTIADETVEKLEITKDNNIKQMQEQILELQRIIKQGSIPITQNNTNNTQNNNTYNIQNIVINKHGQEDMSYLTDNQKIHNLSKGFNSITDYIKLMHFDPAHPENSNIFLPSLKSPDVKLYDGKMWIADDSNDAINTLLDNTKWQVEDNFKELKSKLPPKIKELYEKVINNDNEVVFKTHKKQTRYILYNKKHIPIKVKKANKMLC